MQLAIGGRGLVLVAVAVGLSACNVKGGRTDYSQSPDSGAVASAIRQDTSLTRTYPESTAGGPDRTGKRRGGRHVVDAWTAGWDADAARGHGEQGASEAVGVCAGLGCVAVN